MKSRRHFVPLLNRHKIRKNILLGWCNFLVLILLAGCFYTNEGTLGSEPSAPDPNSENEAVSTVTAGSLGGPISAEFAVTRTPLPDSIDVLIVLLHEGSILERMTAARKLGSRGAEAIPAVPALCANLSHEDFEVRREVARALGHIGEHATYAVPFLEVALADTDIVVRDNAAWALGQLGDTSAVPALAETLFTGSKEDYYRVATRAAHSIEKLVGIAFVQPSYKSDWQNNSGIPFIVVNAQEWWESEGHLQEW